MNSSPKIDFVDDFQKLFLKIFEVFEDFKFFFKSFEFSEEPHRNYVNNDVLNSSPSFIWISFVKKIQLFAFLLTTC